jgi:hypothetical protein
MPSFLATAFAVGKALRKSCVLVADAPAFVVNRLLTRFLGEIFAGRRIEAALVWTDGPRLMQLPEILLARTVASLTGGH